MSQFQKNYLFAIVNMGDFCDTGRVCAAQFDFDENKMRPHLIKCFESQEITPFPTTKHKNIFILKRKLRHTIQIACEYGMADE